MQLEMRSSWVLLKPDDHYRMRSLCRAWTLQRLLPDDLTPIGPRASTSSERSRTEKRISPLTKPWTPSRIIYGSSCSVCDESVTSS